MDQDVRAILARVGELTLQGRLPAEPAALGRLLVEEGFDPGTVVAALREALDPAEPGVSPRPPGSVGLDVAQLSEDATRFLNVLRDLGYLDDEMEDEVLDSLMAECGGNVGLDELRRHVAIVLFDRQYELEPETLRLLEEEWRVVFH